MLDVAGNYPGHRKYEPSNWMCQACGGVVREDQEHLTRCEGYTDLRGDADLENEEELVEFVLKVMNRKKEKNWDYNINPFSLRKFSYTNDLPLDPLTLRKFLSHFVFFVSQNKNTF